MVTAADRTLGELARRLDEIVSRFETLATRLDTTYVRQELFSSYQKLAEAEHARLNDANEALKAKVAELEDGRKWISRLVLGFIIIAVLGAVFTVAKVGAH